MFTIRKLRGLLVAFLIVSLGCAFLVGCGAQKQESSTQSAPVQSSVAVEEKDDFPESYFLTAEHAPGGAVSSQAITNQNGDSVAFADSSWRPLGPCSEGRVFVTWETSDYDKEWKTETNKVTHYGIVGKDGQLAHDLTDMINGLNAERVNLDLPSVKDTCFVDGLLIFMSNESGGVNEALVAVNTKGEVVYTLGEEGRQIPFDLLSSPAAYHDGVVCVTGPLDCSMILDATGKVLASSGEDGGILQSLGNGYMVNSKNPGKVTDYAGNVLFDVESVNISGDIEGATIFYEQPGAGGLVVVSAEKVNPYKGDNKRLMGVYNIAAGKWIVPLSEGFEGHIAANDGVARVTVKAKEYFTEGYGAEVEYSAESYTCLIDYEGNLILDADFEAFTEAAAKKQGISLKLSPVYMQGGIWQLCEPTSSLPAVLVYIENGSVCATKTVDFKIEGAYPNN